MMYIYRVGKNIRAANFGVLYFKKLIIAEPF